MGLKELNDGFSASKIGQYFKVKERGSTLTTELVAGLTTFATLCYVIPVNTAIIGDTGGPCPDEPGMIIFDDLGNLTPMYEECQRNIKKQLITATTASSCISCLMMGLFANMPMQLAPAMGMNAYFAYTVVGFAGSGSVSYGTALTAVFIEGLIFLVLSITGLREILAVAFPYCVKEAMPIGIGFFLTFIGLQGSEGIGLVVADKATLVHLGGCPPENRISTGGGNYYCNGHVLTSATTWLGAIAFLVMALLLIKKIRAGMLIVIVFVSAISWIRDTDITVFPDTEAGDARFEYFKQVVDFNPINDIGVSVFNWNLSGGAVWVALITFLYTDLLDATGTMQAVATQSGFTNPDGSYPGQKAAFCSDATGIIVGSLMGISPITAFAESSAGIEAGGRTGIVALVGALFFCIAMFFAPILSNIPSWATGPALCITGALMSANITAINWRKKLQAVPAFVTMMLMPLTYSIAYGIIGGLIAAFAIWGGHYLWEMACKRMTLQDVWKDMRTLPPEALEQHEYHQRMVNGGVDAEKSVEATKDIDPEAGNAPAIA